MRGVLALRFTARQTSVTRPMPGPELPPTCFRSQARFATTQWAMVTLAREGGEVAARAALEALCADYQDPIYSWFRQHGRSSHDAEDSTQQFLLSLFQPASLGRLVRENGRFRDYLRGALWHFLANENVWRAAKKRGGGTVVLFLDTAVAESRFETECVSSETPDQVLDRRLAVGVLNRALARLQSEEQDSGRGPILDDLRKGLMGGGAHNAYGVLAQQTGLSTDALAQRFSRLRKRFGQLALQEVTRIVSRPSDAREELRYLLRLLVERPFEGVGD